MNEWMIYASIYEKFYDMKLLKCLSFIGNNVLNNFFSYFENILCYTKEIFQYSVCSFLMTKNNLSQWNNKAMQWNG